MRRLGEHHFHHALDVPVGGFQTTDVDAKAACERRAPDRRRGHAAFRPAETAMSGVLATARFWEKLRDVALNDRQRLVINRLLEGFEGALTTSKWAAMTKSSQDTALRDIQHLVDRGVLVRNATGGRSTSYSLAG